MKERNSTFELLRIIAIIFIMIHHVVVFGLGGCNYDTSTHCEGTNPWVNDILNSLCIIGVNLFILITGWFGVKSVVRSLYRLLPVYACVVLFVMMQRQNVSRDTWSMTGWWYVPHYCMLVLCSPLIESSIRGITSRKFTWYMTLLTIVTFLFGYHWKYMNVDGYNFLNFIYLYYLARYLKLQKEKTYAKYLFKNGLSIWIGCSILLGVFHTWRILGGYVYDSNSYFGYNNPLVVLSSIGFFCWFSTMNFKNKIVNFIAGGTFAVYLVSTKEFGQLHIGNMGMMAFEKASYLGVVLYSLMLTIVMYIPCSVVCWVCRKVSMPKRMKIFVEKYEH